MNSVLPTLPPAERRKRVKAYNFIRLHSERNPHRCEICGTEEGIIDGHHALGYEYMRVVQWVCRRCHVKIDGRNISRPLRKDCARDSCGRFAVERNLQHNTGDIAR